MDLFKGEQKVKWFVMNFGD